MSRKFETPLLAEVGTIGDVVLAKEFPDVDDSSGSQPSTILLTVLDLD